MTATESLLPEIINDFFNKIGTELPIPNVRFYGESWRVSGLATEIAKATFMTRLGVRQAKLAKNRRCESFTG